MNSGQFFHGLSAGSDSIDALALAGFINKTNGLVCSAFGPNFAQIQINKKNCPSATLLPNTFESMEHFCRCYNDASDQHKECLTDAVARFHMQLTGIIRMDGLIGKCCAQCGAASNSANFLNRFLLQTKRT